MSEARLEKKREIFKGRVIDVSVDTIILPNGNRHDLELVRHPGAAAIVPVDADGEVTMERQWRYATGGYLLEVPAGKLDHGEDPRLCAERELREETGITAKTLVPLGFIWVSPGFTDERIWLFLALELTRGAAALEADEVLTLEQLPLREAAAMAQRGEIEDAKSVCGLLRAMHYLSSRNLVPGL
jgi:ADP-ribose pyrophosphatase